MVPMSTLERTGNDEIVNVRKLNEKSLYDENLTNNITSHVSPKVSPTTGARSVAPAPAAGACEQ